MRLDIDVFQHQVLNLIDDGIFLLLTIGNNISERELDLGTDKYIFPSRLLPSVTQLGKAFENLFIMEDWQNFGPDYDKTLIA